MLALALGLLAAAPPTAPIDGAELIRQMHARYAGKWYKTLTFVQTTTTFAEENKVETWYESARIPGTLRIDIAPMDSGNVILFRQDSVYRLRGGQQVLGRPFVHPLMVLGFDVYADPAEVTIKKLKGLGFDLGSVREDRWQGRKVWVVGAGVGDSTTRQFWVDQERLLFVRMLEPTPDKAATSDIQFNKYQRLGGGWIAPEVLFKVDGKLRTSEEYRDMRADVELGEALFEPGSYVRPAWVP